jgi:hypothetical protein
MHKNATKCKQNTKQMVYKQAWSIKNYGYVWDVSPRQQRQKIVLITLYNCANSLGLQMQSDVDREFLHKGDLGFNIELSGNRVKQPAK